MTEVVHGRRQAIRVRGLTARAAGRTLVDGVDLDIPAGDVTAVIGGSGSGKTTTALALMGERRPGVTIESLLLECEGVRFGYVPQQPSAVLTPWLRIGSVLRDVERAAHRAGHRLTVPDALRRASFPEGARLLDRYPHQLSGGQQQRLVIAQTLLTDPDCLILDEPTTGQDPANRSAVLDEITRLASEGLTIVLLTHDLDAVRAVAGHVVVMMQGRVVESGDVALLDAPAHQQTLALLEAGASRRERGRSSGTGARTPRLVMDGVTAGYRSDPVLRDFSLGIGPGECVALVGPSGCGKTTAARVVAGLHRPSAGRVLLDGEALVADARGRSRAQAAAIAYVFQDAKAAFDPFRSVGEQIARGPMRLRGMSRVDAENAATIALRQVGLAADIARARVSSLSGGEAQRAAIARALATSPALLICDEVTTGLDSVSQRRVLEILSELAREQGMSLLVISHDAAVVGAVAGEVVEMGELASTGTSNSVEPEGLR
ncbi:ABC transporter ATP-binding protein [Rhodococcus oryzae]|uniref:ABC transporter ATP-binding protein n=1 Tax=Rhodococcus oryzae TaxID=2571143 RepID=A0ABY2RQV5_9NOCA|nr:ATP-binding cassette domain-containing protein [Rhodococcus oryzae]TJZ79970.1 ABC transporter ATP-binding protein [Rhodococcus oryzae]